MAVSARSTVRLSLFVLLVLFAAAQFVPVARTNPPVDPAQTFLALASPPAPVAQAFDRSCRDCHSNQTTWPWYSRVAPVSWLLAEDVHEGRAHLNFSEWGKLDDRRASRKLEEICEEVRSGAMPQRKYTLLHPGAKLTGQEVKAICGWAEQVRAQGKAAGGGRKAGDGTR